MEHFVRLGIVEGLKTFGQPAAAGAAIQTGYPVVEGEHTVVGRGPSRECLKKFDRSMDSVSHLESSES
jgi:hypothetical protein